jgi:seryl-tRNA synthetase
MLDLALIRSEPDLVRAGLARRGLADEVDRILALDAAWRATQVDADALRAERNRAAEQIGEARKAGRDASDEITAAQELRERLDGVETRLEAARADLDAALIELPNLPHASAADGLTEDDGEIVRTVGSPPEFDFEVRDHLALAEGLIDVERGSRTSGSRFAYLLGDVVRLHLATVQFALDLLSGEGFIPVMPPVLVRAEALVGTGFFPADRDQVYAAERDDLYLVGTSEVSLAALHMGEILPADELPRRYCGLSTCFRREAGAAGRDTRGIFRTHQFDKVEMFSFCLPEDSWAEHDRLLAIEERIAQALGLHYQVKNVAVGDLGSPAAKKYDIEAWLPGQGRFRELTSCSNTTDFQARRLGTRYRSEKGPRPVHTLNGTAVTSSRTLIAVLETHQQADGSVKVPQVLHRFGAPERLVPGTGAGHGGR